MRDQLIIAGRETVGAGGRFLLIKRLHGFAKIGPPRQGAWARSYFNG
jgi:hypothetical protein